MGGIQCSRRYRSKYTSGERVIERPSTCGVGLRSDEKAAGASGRRLLSGSAAVTMVCPCARFSFRPTDRPPLPQIASNHRSITTLFSITTTTPLRHHKSPRTALDCIFIARPTTSQRIARPSRVGTDIHATQAVMAECQQIPTFKLVLVGDGGTGKVCPRC